MSLFRRNSRYEMASGFTSNNRSFSSGKLIAVITIVAVAAIGTTLAANINLNGGTNIEFGQGISATTACSGNSTITITPKADFQNESGAGSHKFSEIDVSNIPSSCENAVFVFSAYDDSNNTALPLYDSSVASAAVYMKSDNTFVPAGYVNGLTVTTLSSSSFSVAFQTPASNSNLVYKVAVESRGGTCAEGINCVVGATGPGGGTIFLTATSSGNSTGKYFEVAPTDAPGTYAMCSAGVVNGLALGLNIGDGLNNSNILNGNSNCNNSNNSVYQALHYSNNGVSDWYLPSRGELLAVKQNVLNSYSNWAGVYTTSSQNSANSTWIVQFGSVVNCGGGLWPSCTTYKDGAGPSTRPIRSFVGVN